MNWTVKNNLVVINVFCTLMVCLLCVLFTPISWILITLIAALVVPLSVAVSLYCYSPMEQQLQALETGLLNFKDNEFAIGITHTSNNELGQLAQLFNDVGDSLRKAKQSIYQRELLLDKLVQSSPMAMVLIDDSDHIIYCNLSARHLLSGGKKIEGSLFSEILQHQPDSLVQAVSTERDGLFAIDKGPAEKSAQDSAINRDDSQQMWHLARGQFLLNGQNHQLLLFKQMTRELNRQEVVVWKKVIRLISHELNNSLGPISSLANSGKILTQPLKNEKLQLIFNTISERSNHLSQFIQGYARFAKLPAPTPETTNWQEFVDKLHQHLSFTLRGDLPAQSGRFDTGQIEQVLINLLKNASESGDNTAQTTLEIRYYHQGFQLNIRDRGQGMTETVLQNALLPFYSTKQSGTGLGLPLCREIVEAHDGHISLHNRKNGGLRVSIWLPQRDPSIKTTNHQKSR